jgi:hypothetical protein
LSGGPSQKEEQEERRDFKINKIIKNMRKEYFSGISVSFPGILLFAVVSIHCIYHLFFTLAFSFSLFGMKVLSSTFIFLGMLFEKYHVRFSFLFGFFETGRSPASSVTRTVR